MKRKLVVTLVGVVVAGLLAVPSEAARLQVRLYEPRLVAPDTAVLKGRVTGRDAVVIQRFARARDRWIRVRSVPANRKGYFRTKVRATRTATWYRARAGRAVSARRLVQSPTPPSPPKPPELVPADACGPQPKKADGTYWSCTLAENFGGTELNRSIWRPKVGFKAGSLTGMPCYIDDPRVISVHDGALHLSVRHVPVPLLPCIGLNVLPTAHIAGGVSTYRLFSQQYGRFEARYKNTPTNQVGLHEAFWMWPDDRQLSLTLWPAAGEIDIAETYSQYPDLSVPFLHYTWNDNWGPKPGLNTAWDCVAKRGVYNTYTLEWTPTRLKILVNGKTCLVNTSGDPAFQKPYILALTQMLGTGPNAYDGRAPLPATMSTDYVKVWE